VLSSIEMTRRAVVSTSRRTVAAKEGGDEVITLDDRPLSLQPTRDGKRLVVTLPYEVWILHAETLEVEKTIELASAEPSVCEGDEDGSLWFGGAHLHRGSVWSAKAEKFGSKLGGFVDRVAMLRPRMLCGVGTQGEVLLDIEKENVVHRRKVPEHETLGLLGTADGRAVWSGGDNHAWVIDPEHLSGYMKLKLRNTSAGEVASEAIVALARTSAGHCVLAARDGAVAWTNRALRSLGEKVPAIELRSATPLAVAGDERWIYVLRPGATLHRFLIEQPVHEPPSGGPKQPEPPPLPEAQSTRLPRHASCLALLPGGQLVLAGAQSDDQLGRLWRCAAQELPWTELRLRARSLVEPEPSEPGTPKAPSFIPIRSKLGGAPLAQLRVDDVIGGAHPFWVTRTTGTLAERPVDTKRAEDVLAADALLLPAMVRLHEGTARPALLLWPGVADDLREIPPIEWLTWGDRPREWIALRTPEIRAQGWSRREVFPLQVALAGAPPQVAGRRIAVPNRWVDAESFTALVKECKHRLKVLW
jgi:hypothetical protein